MHEQSLETDLSQGAHDYSTFLHLHMCSDGTFLSPRDERIDTEIRRIAVETGREDRLDEVYFEVVHPDRSQLYSTGSAGRSQVSRGFTHSTGASGMSQQLYETWISTLEERLQKAEEDRAAERAERQALHERMAMMEQYMRQTGKLPPSSTHDDDDDDDDDD
ncbi:uncharacterized protein LOC130990256 [Salvia miltiorrhiza]|uniref:uncharacterized protein LOC130990256 n=1 Tax=Salvia miltiorrhiza TaxID=226208 RepID=UPI0025ACC2B4|nr:uncharacterized protein LOC130990256 [Salvia miltiorrhiza]